MYLLSIIVYAFVLGLYFTGYHIISTRWEDIKIDVKNMVTFEEVDDE